MRNSAGRHRDRHNLLSVLPMNPIHTTQHRGLTIEIYMDPDPQDPREWDNLGVMFCRHGRYQLGDRKADAPPKVGAVVLPLYLYDHSGITMRTTPFSCPWDSGQVGVIYCTADRLKQEFGSTGERARKKAKKQMEQEVRTYDQFLRGACYGFIIKDEDEEVDSLWGIYQDENPDDPNGYLMETAIENADHHADVLGLEDKQTKLAEVWP